MTERAPERSGVDARGDGDFAAKRLLATALLMLLTLGVYFPVVSHPFSLYDDEIYVTENPEVLRGLSWSGVTWAFGSSGESSNWHPVTWLSHMLDVELFGARPGPHHLVSALLHAVNGTLLFWFLSGATGSLWRSGVASALFAIHPLRVESVAWIAERKDVLCVLFTLLTVIAYGRYARKPGPRPYLLVTFLFLLALLSKPMAVTVPLLLLLLDIWPLGRMVQRGEPCAARPLLEKLPWLAMSAVSSVVTYLVQGAAGSLDMLGPIPVGTRLANAVVAYMDYLAAMVWPASLAVIYPYAVEGPTNGRVLLASAILIGMTIFVARRARVAPYLLSGWAWYLVALIPVSGVVQAGAQAMADRYSYLPSIGLAWAGTWGVARLVEGRRRLRVACGIGAVACLAALAIASRVQLARWSSDVALFSRAIEATKGNAIAHNNLAAALARQGRLEEAVRHRREAIRLAGPIKGACLFHAGLGQALDRLDRDDEALAALREAIRLCPDHGQAQNDIAVILMERGELAAAADHLRAALAVLPDHAQLHGQLGVALQSQGRREEAVAEYRIALSLDPSEPNALSGLRDLGSEWRSPGPARSPADGAVPR